MVVVVVGGCQSYIKNVLNQVFLCLYKTVATGLASVQWLGLHVSSEVEKPWGKKRQGEGEMGEWGEGGKLRKGRDAFEIIWQYQDQGW